MIPLILGVIKDVRDLPALYIDGDTVMNIQRDTEGTTWLTMGLKSFLTSAFLHQVT